MPITNTFPNVGYTTNIRQGVVKPGFTDLGFGFSPDQKKRAKSLATDILIAKGEEILGKVRAKNTDLSQDKQPPKEMNTPEDGKNIAGFLSDENRKLVVLVGASAIFVFLLMKMR